MKHEFIRHVTHIRSKNHPNSKITYIIFDLPIGDVRFNPMKHVHGSFVHFKKNSIEDLYYSRRKLIKQCSYSRKKLTLDFQINQVSIPKLLNVMLHDYNLSQINVSTFHIMQPQHEIEKENPTETSHRRQIHRPKLRLKQTKDTTKHYTIY